MLPEFEVQSEIQRKDLKRLGDYIDYVGWIQDYKSKFEAQQQTKLSMIIFTAEPLMNMNNQFNSQIVAEVLSQLNHKVYHEKYGKNIEKLQEVGRKLLKILETVFKLYNG